MAVCFHGWTTCPWCFGGDGRPARPIVRLRCAACGRFISRDRASAMRCVRCVDRGFRPLTLFRMPRSRTVPKPGRRRRQDELPLSAA